MKYYEIMFDDENSNKDEMVCYADENFEVKYNIKQYDLDDGNIISNWDNNFTFYYNKNDGHITNDYLANNLGWFLISPKFKEILIDLNVKNLQFLPVKLMEISDKQVIEGFHVVNITTLTDALDLENSKYTERLIGNIKFKSIIKCVFKSMSVNGLDILRIYDNKFAVYISEKIKNNIKKNKLTGIDLLEVQVI